MDNLYSGGVVWMRDPTPWQLGISFYSHKLAEWVYIGTFNFKTLEDAVSAGMDYAQAGYSYTIQNYYNED